MGASFALSVIMNRRLFLGGLGLSLAACNVSFDPEEETDSLEQRDTAWPDGTYARFRDNGFLYATRAYTDLSYLHVIAAAAGSNWAANNPERFTVLVHAMNEVRAGLCGDAARERYHAKNAWCSEFTRWLYLDAGLRDVSYCPSRGRGGCPSTTSLSGVRVTAQMIALFANFGAYTRASAMTRTSVKPGDYLSLVGGEGPDHHSGIALGVSADYRWIWTAEGNVGDCMYGVIHPFFQDGKLDSRICGVGNIDILL